MSIEDEVYETIKKLQTGYFNKTDIDRYNPEITGQGVSIWRLYDFFDGRHELAVVAAKELAKEGRIKVIDGEFGFISFRAL